MDDKELAGKIAEKLGWKKRFNNGNGGWTNQHNSLIEDCDIEDRIFSTPVYKKAKRILEKADIHMSLEGQRVTTDLNERILRLAEKLIKQGNV